MPALETSSAAGHLLAERVAVSPDGKTAATAGTDQTIKLWDIATGKEVGTLIGNADTPFAVTFLGNSAVMGGSLPTRDTGRLTSGAHAAEPHEGCGDRRGVLGGGEADGSQIAAWASRPAVGDAVKNNTYELYDAKGIWW